jgi:hypothetical protein
VADRKSCRVLTESPNETEFPVCPSSAPQCAGNSFTAILDSLTIVANYACEVSQTPCTLANCRAQV